MSTKRLLSTILTLLLLGVPLQCDCSLLWLWELTERGDIVEGAACDNKELSHVNVDSLACDHFEWGIVIACIGGSITVIIVIVIIAVIVKCCNDRRRSAKYIQCDYLQYNTNVMKQADDMLITTYMQPSPNHQIYSEIDKYSPYNEHPPQHHSPVIMSQEQIYYSVQEPVHGHVNPGEQTVYSSSGSASSDQNTSSTECSMPLRYV